MTSVKPCSTPKSAKSAHESTHVLLLYVVQQLHVRACLGGVSPKLGVGLSQGLDVPQQRIVILHFNSRFLQVLGYLLPNL